MSRLHVGTYVIKQRHGKRVRACRQARHAAKLWRYIAKEMRHKALFISIFLMIFISQVVYAADLRKSMGPLYNMAPQGIVLSRVEIWQIADDENKEVHSPFSGKFTKKQLIIRNY